MTAKIVILTIVLIAVFFVGLAVGITIRDKEDERMGR